MHAAEQGMCTGVRDAANLAWKLALSASGEISDVEELLASYEVSFGRRFVDCGCTLGFWGLLQYNTGLSKNIS